LNNKLLKVVVGECYKFSKLLKYHYPILYAITFLFYDSTNIPTVTTIKSKIKVTSSWRLWFNIINYQLIALDQEKKIIVNGVSFFLFQLKPERNKNK